MSLRRVEGQAPSQSAFLFFLHLWCPIVTAGPRMTYVRSPIFNSHCSCRSLALLTSSSPTSRGSLSARVQCSRPLDHARARPRGVPNGPTRVSRKHPQPYKSENATSPRFRTLSLDASMPPTPPATASPPPCPRNGPTLRPQHLLSSMSAAAGCSP